MVRLEAVTLYKAPDVSRFQFHYGTIRRSTRRGTHLLEVYFNSTMVRLEETTFSFCNVAPTRFQFHYGTIRRYAWINSGRGTDISIPLWYD